MKYFGFEILEEKGRGTFAVLRGENGLCATLSNFATSAGDSYPHDFHVGFIVDTRDQVERVYRRLVDNGVAAEPPRAAHGGWSLYVGAPGGFLVEVVSYEGGG